MKLVVTTLFMCYLLTGMLVATTDVCGGNGLFWNKGFRACARCAPGCLQCNYYAQCTEFMFPGIQQRMTNKGCVPDYKTETCVPCLVENCIFCTSLTEKTCEACNSPYVFDEKTKSCTCQDSFYGPDCSQSCKIPDCKKCKSDNQCLQCREYYTLTPDSRYCQLRSDCQVQFCISCLESRDVCSLCSYPFLLAQDGSSCTCPTGQGKTTVQLCGACMQKCEQCEYPDLYDKCIKCSDTYVVFTNPVTNTDSCICPNTTYESSGSCASCPAGCVKCELDDSSNLICLECKEAYLLVQNATKCQCPAKTGMNINQCVKCQDSSCVQCYEDYTICNECTKGLQLNNGRCFCQKGTFKDSSGCKPCQIPYCQLCENQTYCFECLNNFILNALGTQCTCPQQTGIAYDQSVKQPYCQKCSVVNCAACSFEGPEKCYLCKENFILSSDGQTCSCLNQNSGSGECIVCQSPCLSCQISNGVQSCTQCQPLYVNNNGKCQLQQVGPSTNYCLFPCQVCGVAGRIMMTCYACYPPFILMTQNKTVSCVCPEGHGRIQSPQKGQSYCEPCQIQNCNNCTLDSFQSCLQCNPPYILVEKSTSSGQSYWGCQECPINFGYSYPSNSCVQCYIQSCQSCVISDNGLEECVQCSEPTVLNQTTKLCECKATMRVTDDNQCESCQVKFCQYCSTSADKCDSCLGDLILYNNVCICNQGGPNQKGVCEPCQVQNCKSCSHSSQVCETCNNNFQSANTQCVCGQGFALNGDECAPCMVLNCLYCPTSTSKLCGKCISPFILNEERNDCVCPTGFGVTLYNNGCDKCQIQNCQQCKNSEENFCNKCISPFVLNSKRNSCICPYGQGFNQDGCQTCQIQNCASCHFFNDTICNQCAKNYIPTDDFTQCICPPETTCFSCNIQNCFICQSMSKCASCQTPFMLSQDKTKCICPVGQGLNQQNECVNCLVDHCSICSDPNLQECDQCTWPFIPNQNGECICPPNVNCYNCQIDNCLICSSLSSCELCAEPYISQGQSCVCPSGYTKDSQGGCSPCKVENCVSCLSSFVSTCQKCQNNFYLNILPSNISQCLCPQGYGSNKKGDCEKCQVPFCQICQNSDQAQCSDCLEGFELSADGTECSCPIKTGISYDNTCEPCQVEMCAICPNSTVKDKCVQCLSPLILSSNSESCQCPLGSYLSQETCIPCSINYCNDCSYQNSQEQCIQCVNPYQQVQNYCACPDGNIPDDQGRCGQCGISHCLVCSLDQKSCDYCQKPFVSSNGTQCQCPVGYYYDEQQSCSKCEINSCEECNGNGICNKCMEPFILNNNKTFCYCPLGFFYNSYQNCEPCSVYKCALCSQNTICNRCFEPFILSPSGKRCICPLGQGPTDSGLCTECSVENCASCIDPFNKSSCEICSRNFELLIVGNLTQCLCKYPFILNENNQCNCPPGYGFSQTQICAPCLINNCEQCDNSGDSFCKQCFKGAILNQDSSQCECQEGYGPKNGQGCYKCHVRNCASCENALVSQCLQCSKGFSKFVSQKQVLCVCLSPFVVNSINQCQCPLGSGWDDEKQTCQLCQTVNCAYCAEDSAKCQQCIKPFILSSKGQCVCPAGQGYDIENGCSPCKVSNCMACQKDNPDQCLTCTNSSISFASGEQQCLCNSQTCQSSFNLCLPGYVYEEKDSKCVKCQAKGCLSCSSSTSNYCLKCFPNSVLVENVCKCIKGFTFNSTGLCTPCDDPNCAQCSQENASVCTVCQNGLIVDNQTLKCKCSSAQLYLDEDNKCACISGIMNMSGQCSPCSLRNCKTCTSANPNPNSSSFIQCLQCFAPYILDESKDFCRCPQNTYMSTGYSCKRCLDINCQHCQDNGNSCISCSKPFILNEKGECVCKTGYVLSGSSCQPCLVSNCANCINSTVSTCQECFTPATLSSDQTTCACPDGYALSANSRGCYPCQVKNCASCSNAIDNTCEKCLHNLTLNDLSNQCICKPGYGPTDSGSCLPCSVSQCKTCKVSFQTCSVCESPYVSNKDGTACICPVGSASNGQGGCAACQVDNCAKCLNSGDISCQKCISPYILSSDKKLCMISSNIRQTCPLGHGLNPNTKICQPCQVQNCQRCFKSSLKCGECFSPFISNQNGTSCICPPGQGSNGQDGCSICKVEKCKTCESSMILQCNQCQQPFVLSENNQNCYLPVNIGQKCPLGHGLSSDGVCEPCSVKNCVRCFSDSLQCTVCAQPFVLSSQANQCVCPSGQVMNEKGGCEACLVENCDRCPLPNSPYCQKCHQPFVLDINPTRAKCVWPFGNIKECPQGEGRDNHGQCKQCQIKNCNKCDQGLEKCSICQYPFITNSDAKSCICPPGYGDNQAGGCSLCQVGNCLSCENSMSKTCRICKQSYKPSIDRRKCVQKKFGKSEGQDQNEKIEDQEEGSQADIADGIIDGGQDAAGIAEDVGQDAVDIGSDFLDFMYAEETYSHAKIILMIALTIILTAAVSLSCMYYCMKQKNGTKLQNIQSEQEQKISKKSLLGELQMGTFEN